MKTTRPIRALLSLLAIRWRDQRLLKNVQVSDAEMPEFRGEVRKNAKIDAAENSWHLNVLSCRNVNRDATILTWKEDLFFATGGPGVKIDKRAARIDVGAPFALFCAGVFLLLRRLTPRRA